MIRTESTPEEFRLHRASELRDLLYKSPVLIEALRTVRGIAPGRYLNPSLDSALEHARCVGFNEAIEKLLGLAEPLPVENSEDSVSLPSEEEMERAGLSDE